MKNKDLVLIFLEFIDFHLNRIAFYKPPHLRPQKFLFEQDPVGNLLCLLSADQIFGDFQSESENC